MSRTGSASPDLPAPSQGAQLGPYTPIAAWLQILPEGLHLGQVHLVEGDGHLPNGVVAAEAVIVQDLEVEDPLHHLLVGETWGTDSAGEERGRGSWVGRPKTSKDEKDHGWCLPAAAPPGAARHNRIQTFLKP